MKPSSRLHSSPLRRLFLAMGGAIAASVLGLAVAAQRDGILHSAAIDWSDVPARQTDVRMVREFLRGPTATLDELEIHVSTLPPDQSSHPPHTHPNEELVIVKEGTVEAFSNGVWKRLGPGSVIFNASNEPHAIRNVGAGPATYHVINWRSAPRND